MDEAFEALLDDIFGKDLMSDYKRKRPFGFIDLMIAFETRKRSCTPSKLSYLNVAIPYSLIIFYKEKKGKDVSLSTKITNKWRSSNIIQQASHNGRLFFSRLEVPSTRTPSEEFAGPVTA